MAIISIAIPESLPATIRIRKISKPLATLAEVRAFYQAFTGMPGVAGSREEVLMQIVAWLADQFPALRGKTFKVDTAPTVGVGQTPLMWAE